MLSMALVLGAAGGGVSFQASGQDPVMHHMVALHGFCCTSAKLSVKYLK